MKYWEKKYGKRSKDFIDGVIAGVETYARWEGGKRVVGIYEVPLKDAIAGIKEQLG